MFLRYSQGNSALVTRENEVITASINHLTTFREDMLKLEIELPELKITSSNLETVRHSYGNTLNTDLPELHGLNVGFETFARIREMEMPGPPELHGSYRRFLMEILVAVMQSEIFFLFERGFTSLSEYDQWWGEIFKNNCRYYSNLQRIKLPFSQYISDQQRDSLLFSRQKQAQIESMPDHAWRILASLRDSYHEMHIACTLEPSRQIILDVEGRVNRAPDDICFGTPELLSGLTGMSLSVDNRRALRQKVTGPQGCDHFGDLVVDAAFLLAEVQRL